MSQLRYKPTKYIAALLLEAAQVLNRPEKESFEDLLTAIEIFARNDKLRLGLAWDEIISRVNARGLGVKPEAVPIEPPKTQVAVSQPTETHSGPFNVSLLEVNSKTRSGFVGVYPNGSSFRATAFNPDNGESYVGSHPTALAAAIDRFKWFERQGMPYGNVARSVEDYKNKNPEWSTEKCLLQAWLIFDSTGQDPTALKWGFTTEQIRNAITNHRRANKIPERPLPMWNTPVNDPWAEKSAELAEKAAEAIRKSAIQFEEAGLDDDLVDDVEPTSPE